MVTPTTTSPRKRCLYTLVVVGIVLIAAGLFYRQFWLIRPVGDGPAGPAVPLESFQPTWTERPVVLLGVGDSVTAGLGASRSELSYFSRLIENSTNEFPDMRGRCLSATLPNLKTENVAVSGSNSIQHLA